MRGRVLVALAALAMAVAPSATQAQDPLPPHIDPAAAPRQFDATAMFSFFGGVAALLVAGNDDDV